MEFLVRNLDGDVVATLKARARRHGRSLQAEVHDILVRAARADVDRTAESAARLRARLHRQHSDSGELQAEDRER